MREIKFRAWFKHEKHYRSWEDILTHRYNERWFLDNTDKDYINCIFTDETLTLEQYTGIKDKNGKEIYEGDILDPHGGNLKAVTWVGVGFSLVNYQGTTGFIEQLYHCSIVGNIHENPELLKKP